MHCPFPQSWYQAEVERGMEQLTRYLARISVACNTIGSQLVCGFERRNCGQWSGKRKLEKISEWVAEIFDQRFSSRWCSSCDRGRVEENVLSCLSVYSCRNGWLLSYVYTNPYFLQKINCDNEECCAPYRSSSKLILLDRFFPAQFMILLAWLRQQTWKQMEAKFMSLFQTGCFSTWYQLLWARWTSYLFPIRQRSSQKNNSSSELTLELINAKIWFFTVGKFSHTGKFHGDRPIGNH